MAAISYRLRIPRIFFLFLYSRKTLRWRSHKKIRIFFFFLCVPRHFHFFYFLAVRGGIRWFIWAPCLAFVPHYSGAITRQRAMAVIQTPTPSFFIYSYFLFLTFRETHIFLFFVCVLKKKQHMGGIVIRSHSAVKKYPSTFWNLGLCTSLMSNISKSLVEQTLELH